MIRFLIVNDRKLVDRGLQETLNLESDIEIVGVADNGQVVIQQVET